MIFRRDAFSEVKGVLEFLILDDVCSQAGSSATSPREAWRV